MDSKQAKREGNARGGMSRSALKVEASRLNGAKGGRPKKAAPVPTITEIVQREWRKYVAEHPEFGVVSPDSNSR
jgi:hypothetical protein